MNPGVSKKKLGLKAKKKPHAQCGAGVATSFKRSHSQLPKPHKSHSRVV